MKMDKKLVDNQYEIIIGCEICNKACLSNHRSRKPEDKFELCEHCTKALEVIKEFINSAKKEKL